MLEHHSGLVGLAGTSDMQAVLGAAAAGDDAGRLAVDVYVHRLRREIGAMAAAMDGLDALVFSGGVGEHAPVLRARAVAGLGHLGLALDPCARTRPTVPRSAMSPLPRLRRRVLVVEAREDIEIARARCGRCCGERDGDEP